MEAVLQEEKFFDFGEDNLFPFQRNDGLRSIEGGDVQELKAQVLRYVPRAPGVYGMVDPRGSLIYVGKSKSLRNRLLSYFLPNNEEDKSGRIVQSCQSIVWELQPSDFAALLREQQLIRSFQPRFNVQGIPRRQQPVFVCLGKQPAEQLYTSRQMDPDAVACIGPLAGAQRAARAVEVLNRIFQLRDCSSKQPCSFTDQLQLFEIGLRPGCIRLELNSCLGPCISACSRKDYERQVTRAREFLQGTCDEPLSLMQQQMEQAAQQMHFERAAVIREDLRCVGWLQHRTADVAKAREHYTFVYPVESDPYCGTRQEIWYLIRRGIVEGAVSASPGNKRTATKTVQHWFESDNAVGAGYQPRAETLALVSSWFRKHRNELKKTLSPRELVANQP